MSKFYKIHYMAENFEDDQFHFVEADNEPSGKQVRKLFKKLNYTAEEIEEIEADSPDYEYYEDYSIDEYEPIKLNVGN